MSLHSSIGTKISPSSVAEDCWRCRKVREFILRSLGMNPKEETSDAKLAVQNLATSFEHPGQDR